MDVFVSYKDYHCFGLLKPDLRVSRDLPKGPKSPPEGPPEPLKKHSPFSTAKRTPEEPKRGPESKKGAPLAPLAPPGISERSPEGGRGPPRKTSKITRGGPGPSRGSKFTRNTHLGPPPGSALAFFEKHCTYFHSKSIHFEVGGFQGPFSQCPSGLLGGPRGPQGGPFAHAP